MAEVRRCFVAPLVAPLVLASNVYEDSRDEFDAAINENLPSRAFD